MTIRVKADTKVIDKGYKRIMKNLKDIQGSFIEIGIHERAGQYPEGEPSIAQVAFWNEYGTRNIPARPFLRKTMSEGFEKFKGYTKKVHQTVLSGSLTEELGLNKIGFMIATAIQNSIKTAFKWAAPLAESTIRAKERSSEKEQRKGGESVSQKILIRSGLMLRSIAWRTVVKGREVFYKVNPSGE